MNVPPEEISVLLEKASRDLRAATSLFAEDDVLDIVCFHAQQAAEKALKALLVTKGLRYPYRHDLDELLDLLPEVPVELSRIRDHVTALTPFATTERYEDIARPSRSDAEAALRTARTVFDVVSVRIADETGENP